jgi:hypothetical protein
MKRPRLSEQDIFSYEEALEEKSSLETVIETSATLEASPLGEEWREFLGKLGAASSAAQTAKGRKAIRSAGYCHGAVLCCHRLAFLESGQGSPFTFIPLGCRKKWCPKCAPTLSQVMTSQLLRKCALLEATELRHLVLTIKNPDTGNLREGIAGLFASWRRWRHYGRRRDGGWWKGVKGYAAKMEIEHSPRKGWHPHLHVLVHVPAGIDLRADSPARKSWATITEKFCGSQAIALWVTRITSANQAREISKYCAKPAKIARARASIIAELADATAGTRWLSSWGTLRCAEEEDLPTGLELVGSLADIDRDPDAYREKTADPERLLKTAFEVCAKDPVLRARIPTLDRFWRYKSAQLESQGARA